MKKTLNGRMRVALQAAGCPDAVGYCVGTVYSNRGDGWRQYTFYAVGTEVPASRARRLELEIRKAFPKVLAVQIGYHIRVKVKEARQ